MFVLADDDPRQEREAQRARAHALVDVLYDADPVVDPGPVLSAAVEGHGELRRMIDGRLVVVLPAWEASADWTADGSSTPNTWIRNHTAAGKAATGSLRKTAQLAHPMPHVSAAADNGLLPLSHLDLLTRARKPEVADVFDRDEAQLVAKAQTLTADALAVHLKLWHYGALEELGRNDPDASPGPETDNDTASIVTGFMGRGLVTVELTPQSLAIWVEAVEARIETWRRTGQLTDDDRTYAELVGAVLTDLIADGSVSSRRGQPRPLLIAIAKLSDLFDRADIPADQRTEWSARILGGGPISRTALRELMEKANLQLVITDNDGQPLHIGRARRLATAALLTALIARSGGTCEFPGCHATHHRSHAHHITWWRNGGTTDIHNLAFLCPNHHRLVHHGWTLTRGPTGLEFRRPDGTPVPQPHYRNAA